MKKKVKSYLEGYFLAGNVNKTDRMTAKEMVSQLQILADEGEIQVDNSCKLDYTVCSKYEKIISTNNNCD